MALIFAALPAQAGSVNLALNATATGYPSPLESDPGWGGGSYPWEIVDGLRSYNAWYHGLAFSWGAHSAQATINFGEDVTFNEVILWHHGGGYTALETWFDYWNGTAWVSIPSFTRLYGTMHEDGQNSGSSQSDIYTFAPVSGSKIRYSSHNDGPAIVGGQIIHGWLYEFEVFNEQTPEPSSLWQLMGGLLVITAASAWKRFGRRRG